MSTSKKSLKNAYGLEERQERFCREYIKHFVGTRAAMDAGYSPGNEHSARGQSSRLLANVNVRAFINHLIEESKIRYAVNQDEIIDELVAIAKSDISDLYDERGNIDIKKIPPEVSRLIKSVDIVEEYDKEGNPITKTKVTLHDKNKALEMLAKYKSLLTENIHHDGEVRNVLTFEQAVTGGKKTSIRKHLK